MRPLGVVTLDPLGDGTSRASEVAIVSVLDGLEAWTGEEASALERFRHHDLINWRRFDVGEVRRLRL